MKKLTPFNLLVIGCCVLLSACNMSTPENYFDRAVLNTNTLVGFANDGLQRELDQPSMKMVNGDKDHPVQMKRREIMDNKIRFLEEDMGKLNGLKETDDTREMLQTSKALNEYVLAVYKNEYQQLAKLYDDIADKDQVQSLIQSIHDKYYAGFDELYKKLIAIGKSYAEKHSIKVNWAN